MPLILPNIAPPVVTAGIGFIAANGVKDTTTLSPMPAHSAGNRLLLGAYRDGFVTPPALASGWNDVVSSGLNSNAMRVGEKTAASSSEVSGSWTNSTNLVAGSYSGVVGIGATASNSGTTDPITIPALTLQNTDGSSWVAVFVGHRSGANSLTTAPSGLTYRGGYEGTGTEQDLAMYDTNGGVASFASKTIGYATTSGWMVLVVELKAV